MYEVDGLTRAGREMGRSKVANGSRFVVGVKRRNDDGLHLPFFPLLEGESGYHLTAPSFIFIYFIAKGVSIGVVVGREREDDEYQVAIALH